MNGIGKSFWIDTSKYCLEGARMLNVRGAFPSCPFTGRMKADGFRKGSHPPPLVPPLVPTRHFGSQSGFFNGTPETMSGRTVRLNSVPPSWLGSVRNG